MAALAFEVALLGRLKLVGLLLEVTGATQLVGPHVRPNALLVFGLVAVIAIGRRVLADPPPAGEVVVKPLLPTGDELPTHQVKRTTFVLDVAGFALLAFDERRRVEPLLGRNPRSQIIVIVAVEAFFSGQRFRVVDMAIVAAIGVVDRGVAFR